MYGGGVSSGFTFWPCDARDIKKKQKSIFYFVFILFLNTK